MLLELEGLESLEEERWRDRRVRVGEACCRSARRRLAARFPRRAPTRASATATSSASSSSGEAGRRRGLPRGLRRGARAGRCAWGTRSKRCLRADTRSSSVSGFSQTRLRASAHPHLILAAVPLPPVEPAVERLDDEPGVLDQRVPLRRREPVELHRRCCSSLRTESDELPCALVPVGALEDAALALEPQAVGLLDVLALGVKTSKTRWPPGSSSRAAAAAPGASRPRPACGGASGRGS